jgi:hypothetical protein
LRFANSKIATWPAPLGTRQKAASGGNLSQPWSGHVLFQIKGTDSLQILKDDQTIACRVEVADLKAWQDEWMPVILVLYDGQGDKAYWLYIQQYLDQKNVTGEDVLAEQDRVTVRIPKTNRLVRKAIEKFRQFRNRHVDLMKGGRREP